VEVGWIGAKHQIRSNVQQAQERNSIVGTGLQRPCTRCSYANTAINATALPIFKNPAAPANLTRSYPSSSRRRRSSRRPPAPTCRHQRLGVRHHHLAHHPRHRFAALHRQCHALLKGVVGQTTVHLFWGRGFGGVLVGWLVLGLLV